MSRQHLLDIYYAALSEVNGRRCVAAYLQRQIDTPPPWALVAVGKAACQMAAGAFDALGDKLDAALVISKYGHIDRSVLPAQCLCHESAHPFPDHNSLAAADLLHEFLAALPAQQPLLFLTSGGASALLEQLPVGMTLADLQAANRWLLGSGLDIHAINAVRKQLSTLKAGRLAAWMGQRPVLNLLISDVPGNDLRAIGSGLLSYHDMMPTGIAVPRWLRDFLGHAPPLLPKAYFAHIRQQLVASPEHAGQAALRQARQLGYSAQTYPNLIVGDALDSADQLAQDLLQSPGFHLWQGETTVRLPPNPGQGGRCQHMALAMAAHIATQPHTWFLAGSSDGTDGPGNVAGALVDGDSLARIGTRAAAQQALLAADAGTVLARSGDLMVTGPTGTNVMDLYLGLRLC